MYTRHRPPELADTQHTHKRHTLGKKKRHTHTRKSTAVRRVVARTHLAPTWSDSRLTGFNRPLARLSLFLACTLFPRVRRKRKNAGQKSERSMDLHTRSGGKWLLRNRQERENPPFAGSIVGLNTQLPSPTPPTVVRVLLCISSFLNITQSSKAAGRISNEHCWRKSNIERYDSPFPFLIVYKNRNFDVVLNG